LERLLGSPFRLLLVNPCFAGYFLDIAGCDMQINELLSVEWRILPQDFPETQFPNLMEKLDDAMLAFTQWSIKIDQLLSDENIPDLLFQYDGEMYIVLELADQTDFARLASFLEKNIPSVRCLSVHFVPGEEQEVDEQQAASLFNVFAGLDFLEWIELFCPLSEKSIVDALSALRSNQAVSAILFPCKDTISESTSLKMIEALGDNNVLCYIETEAIHQFNTPSSHAKRILCKTLILWSKNIVSANNHSSKNAIHQNLEESLLNPAIELFVSFMPTEQFQKLVFCCKS
jgi:hypothetical protein